MSDWKYDIDEVGEDADDTDSDLADPDPADPERDASGRDASESGPGERSPRERDRGPLEPGSPTVENAFFVTLGVATMLFIFARVIVAVGG